MPSLAAHMSDDASQKNALIETLKADRANLAARVAELEAALDRSERLAAAEAWYADQNGPSAAEGTLSLALSGDLAAFSENPQRDRYIAAVRAVTRAATPGEAPPKQGEGE